MDGHFTTESERLRRVFVDNIWRSLAAFCLVVLVLVPLRAFRLHNWTWGTVLNVALAAGVVAVFPLRRRMPVSLQTAAPVALMLAAGTLDIYRNGLLGVGVLMLTVVNVIIAMLYRRRIAAATFTLTTLVLVTAGAAFVSHSAVMGFSADYPVTWMAWLFTTMVFVTLGSLAVYGVQSYRQSSQALSARVAAQLDEIAAQRDQIQQLATHDTLTGLPNRQLASDRLEVACRQAARSSDTLAVLFIDLNDFKGVNDRLGHGAGDEVLKIVAQRLIGALRQADTAARLGGDEFLVILSRKVDVDGAMGVAAKLGAEIGQPIRCQDGEVVVGASIGIALYPGHGATPGDLLRHADKAMYQAKRSGAGSCVLYVA